VRKNDPSPKPRTVIIDFPGARASLEATSQLGSWLTRTIGAKIVSQRPGHIVVDFPDDPDRH